MTIEQSNGKARPTLPRASDLPVISGRDPSDGRGPGGRFATGNRISVGSGAKAVVRRMLGKGSTDADALAVARDTMKLFGAIVRELPSDGATVRQLAALQARHTALAAFWTARAADVGLTTPEGITATDAAMKHGQRAERLAVTCLDVASKLAATNVRVVTPAEQIRAQLARGAS